MQIHRKQGIFKHFLFLMYLTLSGNIYITSLQTKMCNFKTSFPWESVEGIITHLPLRRVFSHFIDAFTPMRQMRTTELKTGPKTVPEASVCVGEGWSLGGEGENWVNTSCKRK